MSFICENCHKVQPNRIKETKVVTETRRVTYPPVKERDGRIRIPEGYETVRELKICPECANHKFIANTVGSKVIEKKEEYI